jgi:hypothetical protein
MLLAVQESCRNLNLEYRTGENSGSMWNRNPFLNENSCSRDVIPSVEVLACGSSVNLAPLMVGNGLKQFPVGKFMVHRCEPFFYVQIPKKIGPICAGKWVSGTQIMRAPYTTISHKWIHLQQILKFSSIYCAEENSIVYHILALHLFSSHLSVNAYLQLCY